MESNSVKIEVPAKPMLSPTRSVDEGFESDPDRVSTDSEVQLGSNTQQFDILQRTDRDGVTHTQITRRFHCSSSSNANADNPGQQYQTTTTPPSSAPTAANTNSQSASSNSAEAVAGSTSNANAAKINLICVSGEIDSANGSGATEDTNSHSNNNHSNKGGASQQTGSHPPQKPERTRRSKTKAPQPPANPRSHSVDTIRFASNGGDLVIREIDSDTINGDVLSGKFVRVQVDPNQAYYPTNQRMHKSNSNSLYSIYPNSGSSSLQLWPASSLNYVKVSSRPKQYQQHQQQQQQSSFRPSTNGCNAISSRHHINRISHPVPVCWTQSIPRQARR